MDPIVPNEGPDRAFEFISQKLANLEPPKLEEILSEKEIYDYLIKLFNMSEFPQVDEISINWVQKLQSKVKEVSANKVEVLLIPNKKAIENEISDLRFSNSVREIFLKVQSSENSQSLPTIYVQIAPASNGFIAYQK